MKTLRETWRKNWLESIAELTSIDLQRTSWLDTKNQNPHWTFVEFMCGYFDDAINHDEYAKHIDSGMVSATEYAAIQSWHNALRDYKTPTGDDDHKTILEDPKWHVIVELGNSARRQLTLILNDEERSILKNAMIYPGPSIWP
ncbi:MAG: hypothetical protein IPO87_14285 [Flavobacteriales bacterium]|nr:hypothetical protein [Flavobacteriales bacterium]